MSSLDLSKPTALRYERDDDLIRLTITNMSNHELREILLGLWCRLDEDDRRDHIKGMMHYATDTDAWLSPVASALKKNPGDGGLVDLAALARRGRNTALRFDLTTPCVQCPFRTDIEFYLAPGRVEEIWHGIFDEDGTFACHKTVQWNDDDEHDRGNQKEQHCAGAMIALMSQDMPNQLARIAMRIGMFDPSKLDMNASVFDSMEDMADARASAYRSKERWRQVRDAPGYEVSDLGRVRNKKRQILAQHPNNRGDFQIRLGAGSKLALVHRLVAIAFVPTDDESMTVDHEDEDKSNNTAPNLFWRTSGDNLRRTQLGKPKGPFGQERDRAVLTDDQVIDARMRYRDRQVTQPELVIEFGVSTQTMSKALRGKTFKHLPGAITTRQQVRR